MNSKPQSSGKISSNLKILHKLMENSSDIIALVDSDFIIQYESPSIRKILGYSPKDLIGQNALINCHPDDTQGVIEAVRQLISNPSKSQTVKYRYKHKNGSWKVLESIGTNLIDDELIQGLVINTRDITERSRREEEQAFLVEATTILNSSLNYKKTLSSVAKLTVPRFADWSIVHILEDGQAPQIVALHIEPDKIPLAQELRRKYPPDPDANFGLSQVLKTGKPELTTKLLDSMIRGSAKDEEHYQMLKQLGIESCIYVPIKLRKKILGVITLVSSNKHKLYSERDVKFIEELATRAAIAIDNAQLYKAAKNEVKKTKKAELYVQQTNKELEGKVKKRTKQLQEINDSLEEEISKHLQAQKALEILTGELERSNKELQDFASVASHDLQEPLRKIQAFGDRLNAKYSEVLGTDGKDYLDRMLNASKRMQILINDLLTFSRITTKAQPFRKINLTRIFSEVISDLEIRIESTHAKIEYSELPSIEADPLQIRQLFQNILSNALKFHKTDTLPIIKVYTKYTTLLDGTIDGGESKKAVEIIIEDNGIGFDEKYLDRIFNVFQRLHNQTEYSGTGVGLAVCRKIVERHRGHITAKSILGQGSSFIITLPLKQNQE
jgi:PAS domain S-box-containing protein